MMWCSPILSAIAESGRFRGERVDAVTPYAVRRTPSPINLECQPDDHSAAGRRREHIGGTSSLDTFDADAVRRYAVRPAVRRR